MESTTLPRIDLTITITVILALCAIVSPIFTTIINNHHQMKLEKLKQKQKSYENTVMHKRDFFENYLKFAGRCIYYADSDALKDYGEYYLPALMLAPEPLRSDMVSVNRLMLNNRYDDAIEIFEKITAQIHDILQIK